MDRKPSVDLSTSRVISDTFYVSLSRIGVTLLKPVRSVILGRLLGPAMYGMLNIPLAYIQILALLSNIGFNTSIVKLMPEYLQKGREDRARTIYHAALVLTVALGSLWCVLLIVFAPWIAKEIAHEPDAAGPIRLYALIIPFLALNAFYAVAYLSVQRGRLRGLLTVVHGVLNIGLPIAAVLWRRDVLPVIAGFLTAEVIGSLVFAAAFQRKVMAGWAGRAPSLARGVREIFSFGYLFFFAGLGWNMINSVDRIMVKYYLPSDQLGFYSMAAISVTALGIISATAGTALIPSLTAARVKGDSSLFSRQIAGTTRHVFFGLAPVVTAVFVLAGDVFRILLPRFVPAAGVLRILVFIGLIDLLCRTAWAALVACGRGGTAASAYILAAILNIVLNRALIPRLGIEGAALATLATFILLAVFLQAAMRSASGTLTPVSLVIHPMLLSLAFPLLGLLTGPLEGWSRLLLVLAPGTAAYLALSALTGLVRRAEVEEAASKIPGTGRNPLTRGLAGIMASYSRICRR